mmetsp:Transcript_18849/g.29949  ORF Transcript_18849/g.29949 Transcript_18849/m.29949 type:complete len:375 (+) Transcript_18849:265-1389(+)
MISSLFVPSCAHNASLHRSTARIDIELSRKRLRWKFRLLQMRQKFLRIDKYRMTAKRHHQRNSVLLQQFSQVMHLQDSAVLMMIVDTLHNSLRHGRHITATHSSVSMQALIHNHHFAEFAIQRLIITRHPTTDIHQSVLLSTHGAAIAVRAELKQDLLHRLMPVAIFILLNEIRVLRRSRGIQKDLDSVLSTVLVALLHVLHAHRLSTSQIDTSFDRDIRNLLRSHLGHQLLQFLHIDVAFPSVRILCIVRFVHNHIDKRTTRQFLVQFGGGKVHVSWDIVARFDGALTQYVFGAASLMRGHHVFVAIVFVDGIPESEEVSRSRVRFVAKLQRGPLSVTHGAGSTVSEQVDVHVVRFEQEGVVSRLFDGCMATL